MVKRIPFSLSIILVMILLLAPLCTTDLTNAGQTSSYDPKQNMKGVGLDGDGVTDIAVWRPSNGYWYIINSFDGNRTYTR